MPVVTRAQSAKLKATGRLTGSRSAKSKATVRLTRSQSARLKADGKRLSGSSGSVATRSTRNVPTTDGPEDSEMAGAPRGYNFDIQPATQGTANGISSALVVPSSPRPLTALPVDVIIEITNLLSDCWFAAFGLTCTQFYYAFRLRGPLALSLENDAWEKEDEAHPDYKKFIKVSSVIGAWIKKEGVYIYSTHPSFLTPLTTRQARRHPGRFISSTVVSQGGTTVGREIRLLQDTHEAFGRLLEKLSQHYQITPIKARPRLHSPSLYGCRNWFHLVFGAIERQPKRFMWDGGWNFRVQNTSYRIIRWKANGNPKVKVFERTGKGKDKRISLQDFLVEVDKPFKREGDQSKPSKERKG